MTVQEVVDGLGLEVLTGGGRLEREISGGYASDLLSDVMAHSQADNLWVTLQSHVNVVAVAVLKELAAVVLVNGRQPDAGVMAKARQEQVTLLSSRLPTFELVGRLYQMGIRGRR